MTSEGAHTLIRGPSGKWDLTSQKGPCSWVNGLRWEESPKLPVWAQRKHRGATRSESGWSERDGRLAMMVEATPGTRERSSSSLGELRKPGQGLACSPSGNLEFSSGRLVSDPTLRRCEVVHLLSALRRSPSPPLSSDEDLVG